VNAGEKTQRGKSEYARAAQLVSDTHS
jgi:hypothetical protein